MAAYVTINPHNVRKLFRFKIMERFTEYNGEIENILWVHRCTKDFHANLEDHSTENDEDDLVFFLRTGIITHLPYLLLLPYY